MDHALNDPVVGRLIDSRYDVRRRIASGGMATVYLAFDTHLERDVAVKVVHRNLVGDADNSEFLNRFQREAKTAAKLTHPGLVRVYDQGIDQDLGYLTMEYVDGDNLRHRLSQEHTLSLGEALSVEIEVLEALAHAHSRGLVHRDVKPENVLLDSDGRIRLTDFGLARAVSELTSSTTGTIIGTAAYSAPELLSKGMTDTRGDVYACGVLLYEMVTGRQPFTGSTAFEIASRHVNEDVPTPSSYVAWLPSEVDDLVSALTSRNVALRPIDAEAALKLVRQTLASIDEVTLDRRADPPSGAIRIVPTDADATTVLDHTPSATMHLPMVDSPVFSPVGSDVAVLTVEDEPQKKSRAAWWIAAVLAIAVFAGGGFWWYQNWGPGAYTTVPAVSGSYEDVAAELDAVGFKVSRSDIFDDEIVAGNVVRTDPGSGESIANGSDVLVLVSKGPEMFQIPEVVGQTETEALSILADTTFVVGEPVRQYSDTVENGIVMSISPDQGETVRHDTELILTISQGPEPIKIPGVTGLSEQDALNALAPYSLRVTTERERTEEAAKGVVFRQSPDADSDGFRTQAVTIVVSDGLPLVKVPEFTVGIHRDESESIALENRLKVKFKNDNFWPWQPCERVVGQSIDAGEEVEIETMITLSCVA